MKIFMIGILLFSQIFPSFHGQNNPVEEQDKRLFIHLFRLRGKNGEFNGGI
jgi:hypothetical protein